MALTRSKERRRSAPIIITKNSREFSQYTHESAEPGCSGRAENDCSPLFCQLKDDLVKTKFDDEGSSSPLSDPLHIVQCSKQYRSLTNKPKRRSNVTAEITPHKYTDDPPIAWEMIKNNRPVKTMKLTTPIREDAVRFVCMACLHELFPDPQSIPPGDILIVAGDFTMCGRPDEVEIFSNYLDQLPHTWKVVIAGNHEYTFDGRFVKTNESKFGAKKLAVKRTLSNKFSLHEMKNAKAKLKNAIYLEDSLTELFGIRIYGTPWLPQYDDMAFNLPRGQPLLDKWNEIPVGVDVLITHTPPLGHGDMLPTGEHVGCVELLNSVVKRIRPKYHVFGHIHSGYGCTTNGYTKFVNCSLIDDRSQLVNNPVIFDIYIDESKKERWMCKYRRSAKQSA
uniref:Metallophos domain-containing protein n=1 Tax=Elaeophora elaphi TaxID=1147741 RepID=A0A0R3RHJ1_9BILA